MKTTAILSTTLALFGSAFGAPAAEAGVPSKGFTVIAARSTSPIHLRQINASDLGLFIGKKTSTYCPVKPNQCPAGKATAFIGGNGGMAMSVEVPGGQQVYIQKNGAVGYTPAHSANVPPGSTTGGWTLIPVKGQDYADLSHKGGLYACPIGNDDYQIYAGVKGFD